MIKRSKENSFKESREEDGGENKKHWKKKSAQINQNNVICCSDCTKNHKSLNISFFANVIKCYLHLFSVDLIMNRYQRCTSPSVLPHVHKSPELCLWGLVWLWMFCNESWLWWHIERAFEGFMLGEFDGHGRTSMPHGSVNRFTVLEKRHETLSGWKTISALDLYTITLFEGVHVLQDQNGYIYRPLSIMPSKTCVFPHPSTYGHTDLIMTFWC